MSKIETINTHKVTLPTRRKHEWASSVGDPIGTHLLVEIRTSDGIVGWGETTPMATWGGVGGRYDGSTVDATRNLIDDYLAPRMLGEPVDNIVRLHRTMDSAVKGNTYAKAAVEMACYDAAGKALGVPVHTLLGGAVRQNVRACHSIGIMAQDAAIEEGVAAVREGITSLKIKTARNYADDVGIVRGLRAELGEDVDLRVDGNEGYPDVATAVRVTREQEEFGISICEQPLASDTGLAELRSRVNVGVMADESAWSVSDVARLNHAGAIDYFSLYVTKAGGLMKAVTSGRFAEAMGLSCDIGGSVEFGIGNAANLHLAAVLPAANLPSVLPLTAPEGAATTKVAGRYYMDDIVTQAFRYADGCLTVPSEPGLGIEVDTDKVRKYSS
ncbi:mandelate racemase/muconate lactonizing enzyme family protein [Georgenia thermotolerans]|uniref:Mandelate racemase n=1 Tax=Georgenia thermotolerans TaxID=527326 RepID=A0A7J5UTQ7_9MICO|nr:enolase C-terminal domain-like protein [Georgenia thermotolerans]KAE8765675.1 mandelate racemase [Georgenia thermotolerans]